MEPFSAYGGFPLAAGARGLLAAEEERVLRLREERESEAQRELQVRAGLLGRCFRGTTLAACDILAASLLVQPSGPGLSSTATEQSATIVQASFPIFPAFHCVCSLCFQAARAAYEEEVRRERATQPAEQLCATPFGVDVVGITEFVALTGALVGGISARRRKQELERLNEQLRTINTQLR